MTDSPAERLVEQGAAVVRIENDSMQRIALQRPRDEATVLDRAIKELDLVPALAERIYYSIPYKNHRKGCSDRRNCDCPKDYVRGVSIRGAENLVRRWGNAAVTCRVVEDTEDAVHLEGVFLDLETNVRMAAPRKVSKFRTWNGQRQALYDDQLTQLIASESSKAMRNAILNGLPDWLVESYYLRAREIFVAGLKLSAGHDNVSPGQKVALGFAEFGVTSEQIEKLCGTPIASLTDDDLANLRGLYAAIRDGEKTTEEVFPTTEPVGGPDISPDASVEKVLEQGANVTGGTERTVETDGREGTPNPEPPFLDEKTGIGRKHANHTWREVMKEDPAWIKHNALHIDNEEQKAMLEVCAAILKATPA